MDGNLSSITSNVVTNVTPSGDVIFNITSYSDMYPDKIKMSGLPIYLCGWNCELYKTKEESEGVPVYTMDDYCLYGLINIIGIYIKKYNGVWVLQRECDSYPSGIKKIGNDQISPFGTWTYGAKLHTVKKPWYFKLFSGVYL
jgi:hypothetical protein